ncbi:E3 ubiquitin-protein ligase E3D-like [Tachypleus tridentatus]|uniref:E3 ubiquitin-protein ligase E3D-like n=1 Tax=Tachypleus tridentatus TaxID=6853 RepID=UPI003FD04D6D
MALPREEKYKEDCTLSFTIELLEFVGVTNVVIMCKQKYAIIRRLQVSVKEDGIIVEGLDECLKSLCVVCLELNLSNGGIYVFCPPSCSGLSGHSYQISFEEEVLSSDSSPQENCTSEITFRVHVTRKLLNSDNDIDSTQRGGSNATECLNQKKYTDDDFTVSRPSVFHTVDERSVSLCNGTTDLKFACYETNELIINMKKRLSFSLNDFEQNEILTNILYSLCCRLCGHQLIKDVIFEKVSELPSENWEEMANDWWCHKHSGCGGETDSLTENPLNGDTMDFVQNKNYLYFDQLSYFITCILIEKNDKISSVGSVYHCKRCLQVIGELLSSPPFKKTADRMGKMSKLFKTSVYFQLTDCHVNSVNHLPGSGRNHAIKSVVTIIKRLMSTLTCKICLETKMMSSEPSDICLLLWVMDKNLKRFHMNINIPIENSHQTDETAQKTKYEIPIKMKTVMKVLYGVSIGNSLQSKKWRQDFAVEVVQVDSQTLWWVLDVLIASSEDIPASQRQVDDLMIGFLALENM